MLSPKPGRTIRHPHGMRGALMGGGGVPSCIHPHRWVTFPMPSLKFPLALLNVVSICRASRQPPPARAGLPCLSWP